MSETGNKKVTVEEAIEEINQALAENEDNNPDTIENAEKELARAKKVLNEANEAIRTMQEYIKPYKDQLTAIIRMKKLIVLEIVQLEERIKNAKSEN